jgi:Helix-turn-helix domain
VKIPTSVTQLLRTISRILPASFALPDDGRKSLYLQKLRRGLYNELAKFCDADGSNAYPSSKTLAERLGCSEKTIDRLMADLARLGAINNQGFHKKLRTRIRAIDLAWIEAHLTEFDHVAAEVERTVLVGSGSDSQQGHIREDESEQQGHIRDESGSDSKASGSDSRQPGSDSTENTANVTLYQTLPVRSTNPSTLPPPVRQNPESGWKEVLEENKLDLGVPDKKAMVELTKLLDAEPKYGVEYFKRGIQMFRNRPRGLSGLKLPWWTFINEGWFTTGKTECRDSHDWLYKYDADYRARTDRDVERQLKALAESMDRTSGVENAFEPPEGMFGK